MSAAASPGSLFNDGRLADAIAAATSAVRAAPGDPAPRLLLAEFLLFAENYERVETLLAAASTLSPDLATVVAEFRQLLRAATLRRSVFIDGAVPSFLGEPTPTQAAALRALVSLRAGDPTAAATAAAELEAQRPRVSGVATVGTTTVAFDDCRDADDLLAGSTELLTTTGAYYWVPTERVELMVFHEPKRPRDLLWRRCTMSVAGGPDGEVYVPVCYPTAPPDPSDAIRLGRETDWTADAPVRGSGQRVLLAGDEALPILSVAQLEFGAVHG